MTDLILYQEGESFSSERYYTSRIDKQLKLIKRSSLPINPAVSTCHTNSATNKPVNLTTSCNLQVKLTRSPVRDSLTNLSCGHRTAKYTGKHTSSTTHTSATLGHTENITDIASANIHNKNTKNILHLGQPTSFLTVNNSQLSLHPNSKSYIFRQKTTSTNSEGHHPKNSHLPSQRNSKSYSESHDINVTNSPTNQTQKLSHSENHLPKIPLRHQKKNLPSVANSPLKMYSNFTTPKVIWYHAINSIFDLENMVNWNCDLQDNQKICLECDVRYFAGQNKVVMSHDSQNEEKYAQNLNGLFPSNQIWLNKINSLLKMFPNLDPSKLCLKFDFKEILAIEKLLEEIKISENDILPITESVTASQFDILKKIGSIWINADIIRDETYKNGIDHVRFMQAANALSEFLDSKMSKSGSPKVGQTTTPKVEKISLGWNLKYYKDHPEKFPLDNQFAILNDMVMMFQNLSSHNLLPDLSKLTFAICSDFLTPTNLGRNNFIYRKIFDELRIIYRAVDDTLLTPDDVKFSVTFWTIKRGFWKLYRT